MNFAVRPDFRRLLPAALAIGTVACNPYESATAILSQRLLGCIKSEHSTNPQVTPRGINPGRHELLVDFAQLERTIPVEAVGEYAKKIDYEFNPGDSVKLIIMLGTQYNRRDPQGRAKAEIDLSDRMNKLLQSRRFALDETGSQLRLEKSQTNVCSKTPV